MKKALFIGINDYPTAPLKGCIKDATSISTILERNGDGSPNFSTRLITSSDKTITRSLLREEIEKLFNGDSDIALLYFSGHGFIKSTGGYLVTTDAKKYDEGVSMDEILAIANKSNAKNKVIILDCCHSGAMGTPRIIENNIAQLSEGMSILTASRETEYAIESNGAGVFTSLLIDALNGGASDIRGNITTGSLYSYVDEALGAWEQRPIFKTNISRFYPLRTIPPKVPFNILRNITDYFPCPEAEYDLDPSYEVTTDKANSDKVKIFKELQMLQSVGLVIPIGED